MKNQINNSISAIIVAICLLIVLGCKFSGADMFGTKESVNSETTNRGSRTGTNLAAKIIGQWEGLNEGGNPWKINFTSSSTFNSSANGKEVSSGTYEIIDEENIRMKSSTGKITTTPVQVDGDKLTLGKAGEGLILTRSQTGDKSETDDMTTSYPTPGKTPAPSTLSNGSTVDFPARVGIWRLSKTAKGSEITTTSSEAREIFGSAVTANAAVYVSPDGKQVIWSDNQFDSQERARKITGGIVSRVRESKTLRIIYDTPANGTMFADAKDVAVAFSFSGNSVQMFIGQGSENLRSFISAASEQ